VEGYARLQPLPQQDGKHPPAQSSIENTPYEMPGITP